MRVTYHREADAELIAAAHYYAARAPGLGADFLDEIDRVVELMRAHPTRFPSLPDDPDTQFALCKRFPYGVLFRQMPNDEIRILAVKHHRRDPDYWRSRR